MKNRIPMALAAVVLAAPLTAAAGKPTVTPLKAKVFGTVIDEQDTVGYFRDGGITGCPDPPEVDVAGLLPDTPTVLSSAWTQPGWSPWSNVTSGNYDNGTNCLPGSSACLRADLTSSDKTLSIDTRTTTGPRKFTLDLSDAWDLVNDRPMVNIPSIGQTVVTPALFEVLGTSSLTGMGVCSTAACLEAREYPAKFWFDVGGVTWRVDWRHMRVLRVATNTWYFIADACDGSQVAGLSKLEGSRTKPRETNQGYFLVPFFISVQK